MSREEEQFHVIYDGLISLLEDLQLTELKENYKPKYNNSDVSNYSDIEDYSSFDRDQALEDVRDSFIEKLREIFPEDNKALIMIEKILETYSGK